MKVWQLRIDVNEPFIHLGCLKETFWKTIFIYKTSEKMGLRFKILIGYSILITLLVFIVYLFRQEQIKHNTLQKAEQEMVYTHKLVERTYMHL